jgi:hypothetical protein
MVDLRKYLAKGQLFSDRYRSQLEKNNDCLLPARVGEFKVTDKGAAEHGERRWDVTITVQSL